MRRDTRRRGVEFAAMVDAETGAEIGRVLSGTPDGGDIRPHLALMQPGRRYVQMHTHPGNTAPSHIDVLLLLTQEQVQTVAVVGVDGSWYALSRGSSGRVASAHDAAERLVRTLHRLAAAEPSAPLRDRSHRAWLEIAQDLGLRYDRVQRDVP